MGRPIASQDLVSHGGLYNVLTAAEDVTREIHDVDLEAAKREASVVCT